MNLLNSLQSAEAIEGEWRIFPWLYLRQLLAVLNDIMIQSKFSVSQNGKLPPLPRSSEINGSVSNLYLIYPFN